MASRLSTCFLSHGWCPDIDCHHADVRFFHLRPHLSLPASCKMRHRGFSWQHKRQQSKKAFPDQLSIKPDIRINGDEYSNINDSSLDEISSLNPEIVSNDGRNVIVGAEHSEDHINGDKISNGDAYSSDAIPSLNTGFVSNDDANIISTSDRSKDQVNQGEDYPIENSSLQGFSGLNPERVSGDDMNIIVPTEHSDKTKFLSSDANGPKQLSTGQLEDFVSMIRNAEKNIHLLNQARIRALEDLESTLGEKEALQAEINNLEMKLAETDAKIRVAAQEKVHAEFLENQLEKLRNELFTGGTTKDMLFDKVSSLHNSDISSINEELDSLRKENMFLKADLQTVKMELSNVKGSDERIEILEKERLFLESSLKELESRLSVSQEEVAKLSSLKFECSNLYEKVEHMQTLLDKETELANQAISVLQQNQELRKKVDKLEEFFEEANSYKLSSEKLQQYNEIMQQKIKLLDDRLQKSDEEIYAYVRLYQDSVKEFQDTLDSLKEESKRRLLNEPVDDMPREFWSQLLLMVDSWFLEKKISNDEVKLLREMVWKRDIRVYDAYMECKNKNEHEALDIFSRLTSSPARPGLHVIHIAAELAPVAKVGGLGDVVTGLSKALQKRGHLVEIVLPKYDCMQSENVRDLRVIDVVLESYFDGQLFKNKVWVGTVEGLPVYFIEPNHPSNFFLRGQLYGEQDDFKRFSYFSRAALEFLLQAGKRPDIIHCHDWQTAFVAPLYWDLYAPKGLNSARICFTCHNFEYQGTAPASELASCGLDVHHLNRPDRMQDNSDQNRVNPVKGGIVFSNVVTTVSPTYAQEVRTPEGGRGLHGTLNAQSKKFVGILNGIDADAWNPSTDVFLKVQYGANDLQGKAENKEALRKQLGLSFSGFAHPLVGCVTRLVPQKGVHLIRHAIYRTMELGGQFVLLGSSPLSHIQREFEDIANHFQQHEHVKLILKYDESLAHLIYAASDMFIIPSLFEPCGLTQMIAMRYGAIPIARKTGGLNDSVFDIDDETIPVQFRNGFTFVSADEQGLNNALERAFSYYKNNGESWRRLVQNNMSIDFSWESSASQYEDLYEKSVARARMTNRP